MSNTSSVTGFSDKYRIAALVAIMAAAVAVSGAVGLGLLYRAAFEQERAWLSG